MNHDSAIEFYQIVGELPSAPNVHLPGCSHSTETRTSFEGRIRPMPTRIATRSRRGSELKETRLMLRVISKLMVHIHGDGSVAVCMRPQAVRNPNKLILESGQTGARHTIAGA